MSNGIRIDQLADEVMKELDKYADLATEDLKTAVKKTADTVKKQISATAPKKTGAYARSWATKKLSETPNGIAMVVHSRNRYQLAHLLEFGHAKRGGGRVPGRAHIAPAEQAGIEQLEREIERSLGNA